MINENTVLIFIDHKIKAFNLFTLLAAKLKLLDPSVPVKILFIWMYLGL